MRIKAPIRDTENVSMAAVLHKLVELATVHPNDRVAHQIERMGQAEPANSDLGRPKRLGLPPLSELGHDLLGATPLARTIVVGRPFLLIAAYAVLFQLGFWYLAVLIVPYVYVTVGAAVHDLVHRSLDFPDWLNALLLSVVGGLELESGHTLRETHQVHHRKVHTSVDPEGYVDQYSSLRTLGEGPLYKHYLACWVLKNRPKSRAWVGAEALWAQGTIIAAIVFGWQAPAFGVYIAMIVFGSWLFPYVGVKLVHSDPGQNLLSGTRTMRGRVVSILGCGLTFHLEHHLYPRVPGHKLRFLAQRLDEPFSELGVEPTRAL